MEKVRAKMSREQRAKQFLPFAGVKGLDEALALKEEVLMMDTEKSAADDLLDQLDRTLRDLVSGQKVRLELYRDNGLESVSGEIVHLDFENKILICGERRIAFSRIRDIKTL